MNDEALARLKACVIPGVTDTDDWNYALHMDRVGDVVMDYLNRNLGDDDPVSDTHLVTECQGLLETGCQILPTVRGVDPETSLRWTTRYTQRLLEQMQESVAGRTT